MDTVKAGARHATSLGGRAAGLFRQGVQQALYGVSYADFRTGGTLEAPSRPNAPSDADLSTSRLAMAAAAAAEQRALGALAPADRQRYEAVGAAIGDRPVARRALQHLLQDGTLTASRSLRDSRTLLETLAGMTNQTLAAGLDRASLIAETTAEIQDTVRISQGDRNSCVAATASILLARRHPAEYARLVAGLAAPAGTVQAAGGQALRRPPGWNAADGGRTQSSRLLQSALLGAGTLLPTSYDPAADRHRLGPVPLGNGLTGGGSARINAQLQGRPYTSRTFLSVDRGRAWRQVADAVAAGKAPFPVGLQWGAGGAHEVLLESIGREWVLFTNPSGHRQRLSISEFRSHMRNAEIPD